MSNYLKDEAICLRVIDFSETSQVVTLFVRSAGLVGLLAKGARKIPARTRSPAPEPLDLLSLGQVVFIPPRESAELGTLSSWQVLDHHPALRHSLIALYCGQMAAEVTLLLLTDHDPHPELFDQFRCALESFSGADPQRMLLAYMKAALSLTGYQPRLHACCVCSKPTTPGSLVLFVPVIGGVCCPTCTHDRSAIKINSSVVLALKRIPLPQQLATATVGRSADPKALFEAARLLTAHISSVADRALRTQPLTKIIFSTSAVAGTQRDSKSAQVR
jgi:DNA repair protein RecO (recombination protein O)